MTHGHPNLLRPSDQPFYRALSGSDHERLLLERIFCVEPLRPRGADISAGLMGGRSTKFNATIMSRFLSMNILSCADEK
jgi:hypothetical protein